MYRLVAIFMIMGAFISLVAEEKITIEDFTKKNTFHVKKINDIKSMNDGEHFTRISPDKKSIVKYSYKTGKAVDTLMNLQKIRNDKTIARIEGYEFNRLEDHVLFYLDKEKIYRRTWKAKFYIYDRNHNHVEALQDSGKQQAAHFSPDGYLVGYARDNNMYYKNLRFKTTHQITEDGEKNKIINGIPDWLYEEEFNMTRAWQWSPDSKKIAFIKFDETEVKEYSFPVYAGQNPHLEQNVPYAGEYRYKYPKAGTKNSIPSVHVYEVRYKNTVKVQIEDEDIYIPRIIWTTDPDRLGIMKLNRNQDKLEVLTANAFSGSTEILYRETEDKFIEESILEDFEFLSDGKHFIVASERSGYYHLYLYTMTGNLVNPITKGEWVVHDYLGYDADDKEIYYQASVTSPLEKHIYKTSFDGSKTEKLSDRIGVNEAEFSDNYDYYKIYNRSVSEPGLTSVYNGGKELYVLEDNSELEERISRFPKIQKEFFKFETAGNELNGWIVFPADFDSTKTYPLLLYQYSGPNDQKVLNTWWKWPWHMYMAQGGYIVACIDPRGTGGRGEEFKKSIYRQRNKLETEDQIAAANYLKKLPYVDNSRLYIWGWSSGGTIALSALSQPNHPFAGGIAVAPVTSWRFYDTAYTERYMRTPQDNPDGYRENSPLYMTDNFKGRLLLCHGTADDNVHFQNSVEYAEKLVQKGVLFDMQIYTNRAHSLSEPNTRYHLFTLMTDFLSKD